MKLLKEHRSLGVLLVILAFSYMCFHLFFFYILGNASVDALIGFGLLSLFFSVHRFGSKYIHAFFWEQTVSIYYCYSSLLSLTWNLKYFYSSIAQSYSSFLKMKIKVFLIIIEPVKILYSTTVRALMELYFLNDLYSFLNLKLQYMKNCKLIACENNIVIDNTELELFRVYSLIVFLNG